MMDILVNRSWPLAIIECPPTTEISECSKKKQLHRGDLFVFRVDTTPPVKKIVELNLLDQL